jgi:hypothetical protein
MNVAARLIWVASLWFATVLPTLAAAPDVTLHVVDPEALESDFSRGPEDWGKLGVFEIRRTGSTETALDVYFEVSGTAKRGEDYALLPGEGWYPCLCDRVDIDYRDSVITIPAGQSAIRLGVQARPDAFQEWSETVVLTLRDEPRVPIIPSYQIAFPDSGKVFVVEHSGAQRLHMMPGEGGELRFVLPEGSLAAGEFDLQLSHDLVTWERVGPFEPGNVAAFARDTPPPGDPRPRFYRAALWR